MSSDPPTVPGQNTAPYPEDGPPKYSEAFPNTPYPPAGPPQGQQPYVPGPTPAPGPQPMTTVNYTASTQQMTYIRATNMSEFPMQMVCPRCQQNITTRTATVNGLLLWLAVGTICIFGGFLGCCLIPFCMDGCKDVAHACPQCNENLGVFKRM